VGDTRLPPGVVKEPKGFFPSDELSPPNRLKEGFRPDGLSPCPEPDVERESLLELQQNNRLESESYTVIYYGKTVNTHLARRLHRLSMKKSETETRLGYGNEIKPRPSGKGSTRSTKGRTATTKSGCLGRQRSGEISAFRD
jgi:hypothetical protein